MKYTIPCTLIAMCLSFTARAEMDTSINAGLNLTDGNSETLGLNAGIESTGGDDLNKTVLGLKGNYGETDSATTVQDAEAYANYKRVLNDPVYGYLDASLLHDDIARIDSRLTLGTGLGTYLIKDEAATLGVEAGLGYLIEELNVETGDDSVDYMFIHFGQTYERTLSDTAKVWQSLSYDPEIDDFDNYTIDAEIGIEAAVNASLSIRLVVADRYDATPAAGAEENDLKVLGGLSYKL